MEQSEKPKYKYLFGPVLSRRLGISLGVDLVPHKTCSLNCVYCECGKTTHLTTKRDAYIPANAIRKELDRFLSENPELDYITFSGAGEPTLNLQIQEVIQYLKQSYPRYRVALLTNSTLLDRPDVRRQIRETDLVIASLDSATETGFHRINRPHPNIDLRRVLDGLRSFRNEFENCFWIEVFIVPGINDDPVECARLKEAAETISPDRIHLNSLDRPGTEKWVEPVGRSRLEQLGAHLNGAEIVDVEQIGSKACVRRWDYREPLMATIRRRPCTTEDVSRMFGIALDETAACLDAMVESGEIEKREMARGVFFQAVPSLKQAG
ncbi:MAG: radical SAM protein [Deltaproteobacteria bacterium]|nr:radical SAM protein [Deltaproteobacteria bacterium]